MSIHVRFTFSKQPRLQEAGGSNEKDGGVGSEEKPDIDPQGEVKAVKRKGRPRKNENVRDAKNVVPRRTRPVRKRKA